MVRRWLCVTTVLVLVLGVGCTTMTPVTSPSVQTGDVIVFPGRQAVMMYADVKQGVRDLLLLVETLCAKKTNVKQCADVPALRQAFHDLDVRTRALLLSTAPAAHAGPDYAAMAEMLGKLIGVAAGIAL